MVGLVDGGARGWRLIDEAANGVAGGGEAEHMRRLHGHAPGENQCSSALVKHIKAPVHLVRRPPFPPSLPPLFLSLPSRVGSWILLACLPRLVGISWI